MMGIEMNNYVVSHPLPRYIVHMSREGIGFLNKAIT